MKTIDRMLNDITMYRLVAYGLAGLAALGVIFALLGRLSFGPGAMITSLSLLLVSSYVTEKVVSRFWNIASNMESWLITALILFLILPPARTVATALILVLAGVVAHVSKYLLSWNGKHIFNPAAFAASVLGLFALEPATWWVGSAVFWPFTLLLGLAVVCKIRRFPMVVTFVVLSVLLQVISFGLNGHLTLSTMQSALLSSPLIFLSTIMLTEPATMPPRRGQRIIFAAIIAVLYVTAWKLGPVYIYPEVALLIGNVYAFVIAPKFKMKLRLKEVQPVSEHVFNYVFQPERKINFRPGQYMEWTLAGVPYDDRGNRRTFTVASSPTEDTVQVGLKYYTPSSAYKATFRTLEPGDTVQVSQLQGNFTLDGNEHRKLAFIAGGIGITPFRSIVKYLLDTQTNCDIALLYAVADIDELAYGDVFRQAAAVGVTLIPLVTQPAAQAAGAVSAPLDAKTVAKLIPDYQERLFYVSGPDGMVRATKRYLHSLNVAGDNIKTDYFSGY